MLKSVAGTNARRRAKVNCWYLKPILPLRLTNINKAKIAATIKGLGTPNIKTGVDTVRVAITAMTNTAPGSFRFGG
jgi:hypothetical protein